MTDRELLERAAKAAGYTKYHHAGTREHLWMDEGIVVGLVSRWNPLYDDGDSRKLEVKLKIGLDQNPNSVVADARGKGYRRVELIEIEAERATATRRVIVLLAADMAEEGEHVSE